ncbi:hypothetical protein MACK_003679 [Theileria orientalis]|uniref:Uncharacterized protein n=1 Tax=Theileria orientalis TaxID=68886 RepID=A0A976XJG3_THEOR|nr:hypothetical protein MACK_003679 [Theileria orientalis]
MVTIDLQNKSEKPEQGDNGYIVIEAEYEDSDLFRKFVHVPTTKITENSFILQNKDKKLKVNIDKKEDNDENMYTFNVFFLKYDLENPLIIIIVSENISKFFRYTDVMGDGKPNTVNLSEIEYYHDDVSILDPLYNESFKAKNILIYRLEKQKNYTGVGVAQNDEITDYRVYVHTPENSCKDRISCVSYNNKLVLTYIDDKHESGALYAIQEKTYEYITVYNYDDKDEANLIQFHQDGKSFSYQKEEDGTWKYNGGHILEENQEEEFEDEETETSTEIHNFEHRLNSNKKEEGSGDEPEETKEKDSSDEIPEFLKDSFEPTDYTEEMIRNMDKGQNEHNGGLLEDQQSLINDPNKSSSGLENKQLNGNNSNKIIDKEHSEHDIRAKVFTGTIIPLIIAVIVCPAYMAYEHYFKK